MFYVVAWQRPAQAPHAAPRTRRLRSTPRSCSASRASPGASSLLYHLTPPTQTHRIEPVRRIHLEEADDGVHRHRLINTGGRRAAGRRRHRAHPAVLQQRRRLRRRPPGASRCPTAPSTATARPTSCSSSTRARASATRSSGRSATARATTSSSRSARPGGWTRTTAPPQRMLYLEAPVRDRAAEALPQRLRPAPRARAVLAARHPAPDEAAPRADDGDFVIHVRHRDRITAYHYRHHPFDVVGWDGYLWPFRFNIGDFQPITGRVHQPPPVHQTFQARNFVVCSFVPRKFDYHPLAIPAPYNHSNINQRRGHLLRGRQLHEPARRGDRVVHAAPGRASRTGRTRARSRRRSARRRPRSWPSWSTRSIRCT